MEVSLEVKFEEPSVSECVYLLAADADAPTRDVLRYSALNEGWVFEEARDGITAIKMLRKKQYNLVILEKDLPEISGELVCMQIRRSLRVPVIFVSRGASEEDRLACFAAGGNDFVAKPFSPREVVARVKSFLGLCGADSPRKILTSGNITINTYSHSAMVNKKEINLTPKEYDLLICFCQNPDRAFSRNELLDLVWGKEFSGADRTVDTHVKSLRNKIRPWHYYISTVWGYGYRYSV